MISLTTIAILITFIFIYYRYFFGYWKSRNVYTLPPNILFGNITDIVLRRVSAFDIFHKAYTTCKEKSYRYIGFYFLGKPILIFTDPELIKNVLIKDFAHFTDRELYLNEEIDASSPHLASLKGEEWKKTRKLLSPAFTPSKLKMMDESFSVIAKQLNSVLEEAAKTSTTIAGRDVCSKFIVDVIGTCIFGLDCNTLQGKNQEFHTFSKKVLGDSAFQTFKIFMSMLNPKILYFFKIPFNRPDVKEFFLNLTKSTVEHRENSNFRRKDMMQTLIDLRNNKDIEDDGAKLSFDNKSPKLLTINQIAAECLIFFGIGYETTSSACLFCIHHLICNPSIQEKVRKEINEVLERHNGEINFDSISEMSYLELCILETIRWYPPASVIGRVCTKDYEIPNSSVVVEKGTTVFIPTYEIHQDPDYYPEPKKFIPERFAPESCSNRPPCTYLGYGEGPHYCIGHRLSLLMIKTLLSVMLKNYIFSISPKTKLPLELNKQNVVMTFKDELFLDVEKIKHK